MRSTPTLRQSLSLALATALAVPAVAVEFRLAESAAPGASAVFLVGGFNDWTSNSLPLHSGANGDWFVHQPLADGQYAYRFVVVPAEGEPYWMPDPANNAYVPSPLGGYDSLLAAADDATTIPSAGVEVFEWSGAVDTFAGVIGDFNGWTVGGYPMLPEADGVWRARIAIERPVTYKFFVDDIWKHDPSADSYPDGFGGFNSIREADLITAGDPDDWTGDEDATDAAFAEFTKAGLTAEEIRERVEELAEDGKYGRAVRLLRKSAKKGTTAQKREALTLEAQIHMRFGKSNRAAKCWEAILALPAEKTTARTGFDAGEGSVDVSQIVHDLAKYRLFTEDDGAAARQLYDQLLQAAGDDRQVASILYDIGYSYGVEKRWQEALVLFDEAAGAAPAGDGSDEAWLHFLTELHNARGTALYHLGDFAGAIAAFETTLAITPWPRNQNSQYAHGWIARCQDQLGGE